MIASTSACKKPRRRSNDTRVSVSSHLKGGEAGGGPAPYSTAPPLVPGGNKAARKAARRRAKWVEEQRARRLDGARASRADAVIAALARLWPRCFSVDRDRRRPLMIGIDRALIAQMRPAIESGRISVADLSMALARYTACEQYLKRCAVTGADRINLSGDTVGRVSSFQSLWAKSLLVGGLGHA